MSHTNLAPASPGSALRLWGADDSVYSDFDSLSLHHPDRPLELGRVICVHRGEVDVVLADDMQRRVRPPREATCATGDWVAVDVSRERVHTILPRRGALVRQSAGDATVAQVLASHVDVVLVVTSANEDFSQRRLERYRVAVAQSGATAVGVLSKVDLVDMAERERLLTSMARAMPSVPSRPSTARASSRSCPGSSRAARSSSSARRVLASRRS